MNADASALPSSAPADASRTRLDLCLLMLGALLLYSINVDFTLYGDGGMYADYVTLRKFDELTLHLGYYLFLFVADKIGSLFGVPIEQSAVWLNVVCGTLSVGMAYLLAGELFGNRRDALLCAIVFGVSGRVLNNSTSSEMYMLQTLFVLSSFYLFTRGSILYSGLLSGVAMLVSPLSLFAFLFYPVYDYLKTGEIRWSVYFRLAGAGLLLYAPFFIVDGHEVLFGTRGLMVINHTVLFDPYASIRHLPVYQFKAFTVMLLLIIPALFAARTYKDILILALAVGIPHLYIIFKLTGEDHVFILNSDFFFAACIVVGWRQLEKIKFGKFVGPLLLAGHCILYVASGLVHGWEPHREYADEMRRVARTYINGHDSIMITDWGRAVALSFFGRARPDTTVLKEKLFTQQVFDIQAGPMPPLSKLNRPEVYLLDEWAPSPLNVLLRSKASLDGFRQENSILNIAQRELKVRCTLLEENVHRIYRCYRRGT